MARANQKELIMDAAERVIHRVGLSSTTMDAVAQEAGVSKGGLFYHFYSRHELLLQLIDRYEESFSRLRQEIFDKLPDSPARLLKATVIATATNTGIDKTPSNLMAMLGDVILRDRIYQIKHRLFKELRQNAKSPEKIAIVLLAIDGLWISGMFYDHKFDLEFKQKIMDELLCLIDVHEQSVGNGG